MANGEYHESSPWKFCLISRSEPGILGGGPGGGGGCQFWLVVADALQGRADFRAVAWGLDSWGLCWGDLGGILGDLGGILWGILGGLWGDVGGLWQDLGRILQGLWGNLEGCRGDLGGSLRDLGVLFFRRLSVGGLQFFS